MEQLALEGLDSSELVSKRSVDLRYKGQSYTLNIDWHALAEALAAFEQIHRQRYGYSHDASIELLTIRTNLSTEKTPFVLPQLIRVPRCNNIRHCKVYGETQKAKLLARADLYPGESIEGPAIITEYSATTFVASDWSVAVDDFGNLLLQKQG